MLNTIHGSNSEGPIVYLSGDIDENCNLDQLFGAPAGDFQINCRGIRRINSAGVRSWILYFRKLSDQKIRVRFVECSPAFVLQVNLFPDFLCNNEIVSIQGPYMCSDCGTESFRPFTREMVHSSQTQWVINCGNCDGYAKFDDDPQDYFQIWMGS